MTRFLLFVILFGLLNSPAFANCSNPGGAPGDMVYNGTHHVFQGCTTKGWMAFHARSPIPPGPEGCPTIGDVCTGDHAGMIYGGNFNGHKLYVAGADQPGSWRFAVSGSAVSGLEFCNFSSYTGVFSGGTCDTGRENTQSLDESGVSFPAAEECAGLVAHGHDDWYLPSIHELYLIRDNLYEEQPAGKYGFQAARYWSSSDVSEEAAGFGLVNDFAVPFYSLPYVVKFNITYRLRCVRY